jgi:hypothetical protein
MDKDIRVQRVAVKVHAVERSIDDTLALAAELMLEMRGACADLNLAAQSSDGAFAKLIEAMSALQTARTSVVASHKRMDRVREALGLRTSASVLPGKIDDESGEPVTQTSVARIHG